VRLTSSTLGSLEIDKAAGLRALEAAATARAPRRLVPRTPTMTPPNEPEDIDAWALVAGLEEQSALLAAPFGRHSFSFPIAAPQEFAPSSKVTPLPMRLDAGRADPPDLPERAAPGPCWTEPRLLVGACRARAHMWPARRPEWRGRRRAGLG
jgi:glutaredoxin domain-containing cysteine-rich protein 1